MQLEQLLKNRRQEKDILLMTHIVLGYPSFEVNRQVIRQMVENGVDCIEMQIPFSEPMADGPVILKANQESIAAGTTIADCLEFGAEMVDTYDIPFLFMTYYNIIFKYGEERFLQKTRDAGLMGLIIPDLPPEMGENFFRLAEENEIDLTRERVSLWRLRGGQDFEHLASSRSIYQAVQLAETFGEDLFLFDAPAGDVLTLVAAGDMVPLAAAGEGK